MDERNLEEERAEYRRRLLDECRGRQFVRRTFASYPSLRAIEPSEDGWYVSEPYTGQNYDPEKFWVCEGGWDHEHCHVCNATIDPGDEYWQSDEPWPLELCLACHERLMAGTA
ncbi:MAG TPA: hypothetical protein VKE74_18545 [Gemmataceae bacterium]|nr:hypothetical protein [Gemmataceae bacterium]